MIELRSRASAQLSAGGENGSAPCPLPAARCLLPAACCLLPAILLALAACGKSTAPPGAGQPATTERETAARPPRRIVSIVPAVTEMLFAIGAGPTVVAVGSFDKYPPEVRDLPRVGALVDPDIERIISLGADLVIVDRGQVDLQRKLANAKIATFPYALGGLDNVGRTIRELGTITGHARQAALVAETIESGLASLRGRMAGLPRPPTMLVFSREPGGLRNIYASGGIGFLNDVLEVAGGTNLFANVRRESLQVTTETILSSAPDVILELRYGAAFTREQIERDRASWNVLASVPAVRHGRVYELVGDELVVPGPRVVDTAERMARVLHPEVFAR
jgi:iron complex transport system substrate-binding protein